MNAVNPMWVAVIVGVVSSCIASAFTGALAYAALKAWMARREEREKTLLQNVASLQSQLTTHGGLLGEHAVRIGVLENEVGLRSAGDFSRRP